MTNDETPNTPEKYVDVHGLPLADKPDYMTQLRGNVLVSKNDPRITLRGRLDSLAARVMEVQCIAAEAGERGVTEDLQDIRDRVFAILSGEVTGRPVGPADLFGMDEERIHDASHHPHLYYGIGHRRADYKMGRCCVAVNSLRAESREVELAAVHVFVHDGAVERPDLLRALNRLSSALYVVMCRIQCGYYREKSGTQEKKEKDRKKKTE